MHYFDIVAVIVPEKGPRKALLVQGCAAYNKVLDQADVQAGGKRHFPARVKAYLRIAWGRGARSMMHKEDDDDKNHARDEARSVRGWLAGQGRKFHGPMWKCGSKGCSGRFYAWRSIHGVLFFESVKMDKNGRVIEHQSSSLASGLGAFSVK